MLLLPPQNRYGSIRCVCLKRRNEISYLSSFFVFWLKSWNPLPPRLMMFQTPNVLSQFVHGSGGKKSPIRRPRLLSRKWSNRPTWNQKLLWIRKLLRPAHQHKHQQPNRDRNPSAKWKMELHELLGKRRWLRPVSQLPCTSHHTVSKRFYCWSNPETAISVPLFIEVENKKDFEIIPGARNEGGFAYIHLAKVHSDNLRERNGGNDTVIVKRMSNGYDAKKQLFH